MPQEPNSRFLPDFFYCPTCFKALIERAIKTEETTQGVRWGDSYLSLDFNCFDSEVHDEETTDYGETIFSCDNCENTIPDTQIVKLQNFVEMAIQYEQTLPPFFPPEVNLSVNQSPSLRHRPYPKFVKSNAPDENGDYSYHFSAPFLPKMKELAETGQMSGFNFSLYDSLFGNQQAPGIERQAPETEDPFKSRVINPGNHKRFQERDFQGATECPLCLHSFIDAIEEEDHICPKCSHLWSESTPLSQKINRHLNFDL